MLVFVERGNETPTWKEMRRWRLAGRETWYGGSE
jgi:hypothetical protein